MFDLEYEVAKWRTGLKAGLLPTETIDELESHLREELDRQVSFERTGAESFAFAVQQLGEAELICGEFAKEGKALRRGTVGICALLSVGFIHTRDIKVLAFSGGVLGLLGFIASGWVSFLYHQRLQYGVDPEHVIPIIRSIVGNVIFIATCALAVAKSWHCFRSHEMAAARSLVGFNLLIGWLLVAGLLDWIGYVIVREHLVFHAGPVPKFLYYSASLVVACIFWCTWMRRLARVASADPIHVHKIVRE